MKWISVKDRLPPGNENVLVFFGGRYRPVREGYISRMGYNHETDKDFDVPLWTDATEQYGDEGSPDEVTTVTHWMPLPEPPKE